MCARARVCVRVCVSTRVDLRAPPHRDIELISADWQRDQAPLQDLCGVLAYLESVRDRVIAKGWPSFFHRPEGRCPFFLRRKALLLGCAQYITLTFLLPNCSTCEADVGEFCCLISGEEGSDQAKEGLAFGYGRRHLPREHDFARCEGKQVYYKLFRSSNEFAGLSRLASQGAKAVPICYECE